MARVKMPLMSLSASGEVGNKALQFRTTRHGAEVVIPALVRSPAKKHTSPAQADIRMTFREAKNEWAELDGNAKAEWAEIARLSGVSSGWNAYLAMRMKGRTLDPDILTLANGQPLTTPQGLPLRV